MNVFANIAVVAAESGTEFQSPNKWFPESAEIIWGTIAFVIIVGLLWTAFSIQAAFAYSAVLFVAGSWLILKTARSQ
jgi:hypothetical protein